MIIKDFDRKSFEDAMADIYKERRRSRHGPTHRPYPEAAVTGESRECRRRNAEEIRDAQPLGHRQPGARDPDSLAHPVDRRAEFGRRADPRCPDLERRRIFSSAWDEVRQVRESDRILALLESETSRLQNLIHRYINQPNPEVFAEILLLREAVLGTLNTRASTDPMLAGSVQELERVTEKFLDGFGELRGIQNDLQDLRGAGADPGPRHGRALRHHRGRQPSRLADLTGARQIARSVHVDAGRSQCLLPVASDGIRR